MEGNVLLRTLTRKSNIGFGQYKDWSVGQMMDMCKTKDLVTIYYSLSKIDFCEELKKELCMTENLQVKKPGKGYGCYDYRINKVVRQYLDSLTPEQEMAQQAVIIKNSSHDKRRKKFKDQLYRAKTQSKMLNRNRNLGYNH